MPSLCSTIGSQTLVIISINFSSKLEGARARTGLCVDVSSGVMIGPYMPK